MHLNIELELKIFMHSSPKRIRPKISSIPRQNSAAATSLDVYKLQLEKTRLQKRLNALHHQEQDIQQRLQQIEQELSQCEHKGNNPGSSGTGATVLDDAERSPHLHPLGQKSQQQHNLAPSGHQFETFVVDY